MHLLGRECLTRKLGMPYGSLGSSLLTATGTPASVHVSLKAGLVLDLACFLSNHIIGCC